MPLGERIKALRQHSKLSQEKLAELVGVSRQAVTKWESGQAAPSTENVFKLAEIFGTTVDLLIAPANEKEQPAAEQGYLLYKTDQENNAAALRAKRKKNVRMALAVTGAYLAVFLLGRILWGSSQSSVMGWLFDTAPGHAAYLFGWLISSRMYLIAFLVSVVPALFGKYRFSIVTASAFLLGLLLGEWLGPNPSMEPYEMSHYGWLIWGGVYLVSMAIGIVLEKRGSRSRDTK